MNKALTLVLLASLSLAAPAQQDRIEWSNGTVTDRARVTGFTVFEIRYSVRATRAQAKADTVIGLEVERVREAYRRGSATNDPGQYLVTARARLQASDNFLAQFGFYFAAKAFLDIGESANAFNTLDELATAIPDSGFLPDCYRLKMAFHLSQGRQGGARAVAVAKQYLQKIQSGGMPDGFALEAEFFQNVAEFTAGTMNPAELQRNLNNLRVKVSAPFPALGNRTQLWIGTAQRLQGQAAGAKKIFEELAEKDTVDVNTRAGAFLGLGHLEFAQGNPTNKGAYREALLHFLRVYVEAKEADSNLVAEALHFASESAQKWGGQDSPFMNRRLKLILTQDYPNSSWASR